MCCSFGLEDSHCNSESNTFSTPRAGPRSRHGRRPDHQARHLVRMEAARAGTAFACIAHDLPASKRCLKQPKIPVHCSRIVPAEWWQQGA